MCPLKGSVTIDWSYISTIYRAILLRDAHQGIPTTTCCILYISYTSITVSVNASVLVFESIPLTHSKLA